MSDKKSPPCLWAFDVETSIEPTQDGKFTASAFHPRTEVVKAGEHVGGKFYSIVRGALVRLGEREIVAGHNIKFDLHHCYDEMAPAIFVDKGSVIWDTQLADYIISGQENSMTSLNDLSYRMTGERKVDGMKEYFEQGIGADKIDPDLVDRYLKQDLKITYAVADKQMQIAAERGMVPLMRTQMDALLATTEMEWNGMKVDLEELIRQRNALDKDIRYYESQFKMSHRVGFVRRHVNNKLQEENEDPNWKPPLWDPSITSSKDLSLIFFGGTFVGEVYKQVGHYKNSKPKYRKTKVAIDVRGNFDPGQCTEPTKNEGVYKVDASVLEALALSSTTAQLVLDHRTAYKLRNTFVEGITNNLALSQTEFLHHRLHHAVTGTGRLSSSDPNLQNMPGTKDCDLKKVFVSRFEGGHIVEADYRQLEVVALAYITGDEQLKDDILCGRDMHYETGKAVMGWTSPSDMDKDDRRTVKTINFGLIYGGGAKTLAKQAGVTVKLAQQCIDAFYNRYPGVKAWQQRMLEDFQNAQCPVHDKEGRLCHYWTYKLPTGRVYTFRTYYWDGNSVEKYPITKMVNYPIQGFATGDIVPMVLGKLLAVLKSNPNLRDKCLMVNTVHDSIVFDVHPDVFDHACRTIKSVMEKAPTYLADEFSITDFVLPLTAELTAGPNWKDQTEVDV